MLSAFRAGGRFAWVPAYLLVLFVVMVMARAFPLRMSRALLMVAAVIQLVDAEPLRSAIRLDTRTGMKLFHEEAWRPVLADVRQIVILPSFECGDERRGAVKTSLHLMAARIGPTPIPINSASQSRTTKDCKSEFSLLEGGPKPGWIYFFFDTDPHDERAAAFRAAHEAQCRPFAFGQVCRGEGGVHYDGCADEGGRPRIAACAMRPHRDAPDQ